MQAEVSRPYFEREIRMGRRVVFQWNPLRRFGKDNCPECSEMGNDEGDIIEGFIFTDERRAEVFDLDYIRPYDPNDEENLTRFRSWADAEDWVRQP